MKKSRTLQLDKNVKGQWGKFGNVSLYIRPKFCPQKDPELVKDCTCPHCTGSHFTNKENNYGKFNDK